VTDILNGTHPGRIDEAASNIVSREDRLQLSEAVMLNTLS